MAIEIKELKVIIKVNKELLNDNQIRKVVREELNIYADNLKDDLELHVSKRAAKSKIR